LGEQPPPAEATINMILAKVGAQNLKGATFQHQLGPCVAIQGPNFSGKTAIFEAIRLAILGHIPEVGKLPKATWELASGDRMSVRVTFDNGGSITRVFQEGKTPIVSQDEAELFDLPLLNAEHYFGLTDSERTNYVFRHVRLPAVYTPASIIAELERLTFEEAHTEGVEVGKAELIKACRKRFDGTELQDALSNLVDYLAEQFSYWNRRAKETQGAVTTLTDLKLRSEDETLAAPADLEEQIAAVQDELDTINTDKGGLIESRDAAERNAGRRKMLQKELDKDRIDYPRMLTQKQTDKEALEKQLVPEPEPAEIEKLRGVISDANSAIRTADQTVEEADKKIGEIHERRRGVAGLEECPYCHAKGAGWKKVLAAELNTAEKNYESAIKDATKSRDKAAEILRDANETLETFLREQESNHRLREQIRQIEREIGNIQADQRTEQNKRQRYEDEIAELEKGAIDPKSLDKSIEQLEQRRQAAATKLKGLNGRKTAETQMKQDLRRAEESAKEHRDALEHVLVIKAFGKVLKAKREGLIAEAFTSLLQVANMFAKSILKSPLVLVNNTIGRMVGDKFVPHRVFTGAEKALTYIAIATALSAQAPIRLVLLDELGRFDAEIEGKVINRLVHLVNEKVIDQFLVATPRPLPAAIGKVVQLIEVNG
jgi:hypothetical protein